MTSRGFFVCGALCTIATVAVAGGRGDAGVGVWQWQPDGLHPSQASLAMVFERMAATHGPASTEGPMRREQWTYENDARRYPVQVVVSGDDYRATVDIDGAKYAAGRADGTPWRADANGVAHATLGDIQADAVDRLPHALFPFAQGDCAVAGEADAPVASWVLVDRAPRDKPHWFWVDKQTGEIVREQTREGVVLTTIEYGRFENVGGMRATRWSVTNGNRADDLAVTVDAVSTGAVDPAEVAPPTPAPLFGASAADAGTVTLPALFRNEQVRVLAKVSGRSVELVLDSGTQSIMLDPSVVARAGAKTVLDHAVVGSLRVGGLEARGVSVMSLPLGIEGILGYDFFVGRVVHFDYRGQRIEVLSESAAERVFSDPKVVVLDANYSEGLPLVTGRVGDVAGNRFALDTGSPHFFLFLPFAQTVARALSGDDDTKFPWNRRTADIAGYLEGGVPVKARWLDEFAIGPLRFRHLVAGVQDPRELRNQVEMPFDAIVGTDELRTLDVWFDVDGKRVAFRG